MGLIAPISGQIDPIRLGREQRAMDIANAYAERLGVSPLAIARLTTDYPDHGFVIDLTEAKQFLNHARELKPHERALEDALAAANAPLYYPSARQDIVTCLTAPDAATIHANLNERATDDGIPKDPEGDSGEAPRKDPGVRSPGHEADGSRGPSDPVVAPATH